MPDRTIGEILLSLKERSGLSLNSIAHRAGYAGPSSVQAFFHAAYDPPGLAPGVATRLASAFAGRGNPMIEKDEVINLITRQVRDIPPAEPRVALPHGRNFLDSDVPVYATTKPQAHPIDSLAPLGLQFGLIRMDRPLRYYPRAAGLSWNENAFALHSVGNSMAPRFKSGEPLFISDSTAPSFGSDVLLLFKHNDRNQHIAPGSQPFLLGRLGEESDSHVFLHQYGTNRTGGIELALVERMHRIAPWAEVCGLPYA